MNQVFGVISVAFVAILVCAGIVIKSLLSRLRDSLYDPYRRLLLLGVRPTTVYRSEIVLHILLVLRAVVYGSGVLLLCFWASKHLLTLPIEVSGYWYFLSGVEAACLVGILYAGLLLFSILPMMRVSYMTWVMWGIIAILASLLVWILTPEMSSLMILAGGVLLTISVAWIVRAIYT